MADLTSEQQAEQKHAARAKRRYISLQLDGRGPKCVVEPQEADQMVKDDPALVASETWMTVAEFESLPDFEGF